MRKYYWLKLKDDFFEDKRIKKLRKIAGGDTYTIIYLKMQLLSLKNEGVIYFDGVEDTFEEEIALQIDEDVEDVKITIGFLLRHNLLEQVDGSEYQLPETKSCIGSETQGAERVRRFRENKKKMELEKEKVLQCNADVTKCNVEIEKEKEIDIKENNKKKNFFENEEVNNIFLEFLQLRKKIKAVNSDRAINTLVNKLNKFDDDVKYKMIEQSIVNSWKDVYELKEPRKRKDDFLERLDKWAESRKDD